MMGSLWNRSGTIERFGADDQKAVGALAYFYQGGTTTPLTVYQDSAQGSAHPFPLAADANGRWPTVFVPYVVSYDVRVTTEDNVQLTFTQGIPNPDPVSLSVTIPAENQVSTGMVHAELASTTKTGYVRLNGRTLGNAASGATERANADAQNLYVYLWNNLTDAIATVSGGRGSSGTADFTANKTILLPDFRGRTPIGLDDMGNAASGAFAGLGFSGGTAITPGAYTGVNTVVLAAANMPAHSHAGTTSSDGSHQHLVSGTTDTEFPAHAHTFSGTTDIASVDHTHTIPFQTGTVQAGAGAGAAVTGGTTNTSGQSQTHTHTFSGGTSAETAVHTHTMTFNTGLSGVHSHTFTTDAQGSGQGYNNIPQASLVTWYIKL